MEAARMAASGFWIGRHDTAIIYWLIAVLSYPFLLPIFLNKFIALGSLFTNQKNFYQGRNEWYVEERKA